MDEHCKKLYELDDEFNEIKKTIRDINKSNKEIEKEIEKTKSQLVKKCEFVIKNIEDISYKISEYEILDMERNIMGYTHYFVDQFGEQSEHYSIRYENMQIVQEHDCGNKYYGNYLNRFSSLDLVFVLRNLLRLLSELYEKYYFCKYENEKINKLLNELGIEEDLER
jgi:hypothetical protein